MVTQDARYKAGNQIITSAYVNKPFDEAKAELEGKGYIIASPENFALLRIAKGANHNVSLNGAYTSMGDIMIPKKGRFLTKFSAVMQSPKEATQAHRECKEFYVANEDTQKLLASGNVVIPYNQASVPTDRFAEDPITVFVFGKTAKAYGEFLKQAGINAMPLWFNDEKYINSQENPFANQLWLLRLDSDNQSSLGGNNRGLYGSNAVRGVRMASTEGAKPAKKVSAPNLRKILKYSRQFVPSVARTDFEKGLEAMFRKQ